jgi:hypothetical protein
MRGVVTHLRLIVVSLGLGLGVLAGGCGNGLGPGPMDLGPDAPVQLSLSLSLSPPTIDGLVVDSGRLELSRVGVFGDIPADQRTLIGRVEFMLPSDSGVVPFPDAPYGLYSRTCASLDDVAIQGSWRNVPLSILFEVEYLSVDLRAAGVEYTPTQGATLSVTIDTNKWFDPSILDGAMLDNGVLRIDGRHNTGIAVSMARAIADSFTLTTSVN